MKEAFCLAFCPSSLESQYEPNHIMCSETSGRHNEKPSCPRGQQDRISYVQRMEDMGCKKESKAVRKQNGIDST